MATHWSSVTLLCLFGLGLSLGVPRICASRLLADPIGGFTPTSGLPPASGLPPTFALSPTFSAPPASSMPPAFGLPPSSGLPPAPSLAPDFGLPPASGLPPTDNLPPMSASPPSSDVPPTDLGPAPGPLFDPGNPLPFPSPPAQINQPPTSLHAPPPAPLRTTTTNVTVSHVARFVIASNADGVKGGPPMSVDDIVKLANQACAAGSTACTSAGLDLNIPGSFWNGDQDPRQCDGSNDPVRCGSWEGQGTCSFSFDGSYARDDIRQSLIGLLKAVLQDQYANKPNNNFCLCLQSGQAPFSPETCTVGPSLQGDAKTPFTPGYSMPAEVILNHFIQSPGNQEPAQGASIHMKVECAVADMPMESKCDKGALLGSSVAAGWLSFLAPELAFAPPLLGTVAGFCA